METLTHSLLLLILLYLRLLCLTWVEVLQRVSTWTTSSWWYSSHHGSLTDLRSWTRNSHMHLLRHTRTRLTLLGIVGHGHRVILCHGMRHPDRMW